MQTLSIDPTTLVRYRVGPLGSYLDAYLTSVRQEGFSTLSILGHVQAIKRFSLWLQHRHLGVQDLNEVIVEQFLQRDPAVKHKGESATLARLLLTLREIRAIAGRVPEPITVHPRVADQYRQYLLRERGLSQKTVSDYVLCATGFVSHHLKKRRWEFSTLRALEVTTFVQHHVRQSSPARVKLLITALRSFLRYLRHEGKIGTDLAACVPAVANWSYSTLPKFLPAGTVQRVLDRYDRSTADGKRNYAILMLLARLAQLPHSAKRSADV